MRFSSPAFQEGKPIPSRFAYHGVAGGKNNSLPFVWDDVPDGTRSFALSIVDPHPVANNWVHWLVVNVPPATRTLPEGASGKSMPAGSRELYNSYGREGYGGPQPPKGSGPHPYETTLYALAVDHLEVSANTSLSGFRKTLEGSILATARTTGIFER